MINTHPQQSSVEHYFLKVSSTPDQYMYRYSKYCSSHTGSELVTYRYYCSEHMGCSVIKFIQQSRLKIICEKVFQFVFHLIDEGFVTFDSHYFHIFECPHYEVT